MPEPRQNDISEALGKVSKGLTALKEVWAFAGRVAALQDRYKGQAIPVGELFSAMLGFGDKPNPLEFVEKQLAEINAKLDRVLAGIEELKVGQLGQGVLSAYLDMSDPVYLIEKYFHDLVGYQDGAQPWTEAERKEFVDKLLGTRSERDSVAFCTHKIVKLSPVTQSPLLFDLLFPYLLAGAQAENAHEIYLKGAFAFSNPEARAGAIYPKASGKSSSRSRRGRPSRRASTRSGSTSSGIDSTPAGCPTARPSPSSSSTGRRRGNSPLS
jgi:hypothetical protein